MANQLIYYTFIVNIVCTDWSLPCAHVSKEHKVYVGHP